MHGLEWIVIFHCCAHKTFICLDCFRVQNRRKDPEGFVLGGKQVKSFYLNGCFVFDRLHKPTKLQRQLTAPTTGTTRACFFNMREPFWLFLPFFFSETALDPSSPHHRSALPHFLWPSEHSASVIFLSNFFLRPSPQSCSWGQGEKRHCREMFRRNNVYFNIVIYFCLSQGRAPKVLPVSRTTKLYSYFRWCLFFFVPSPASSCTEGMHNSHSAYHLLWDDQPVITHGWVTEHRLQDDVSIFKIYLSLIFFKEWMC